jgi:hypothetical protein
MNFGPIIGKIYHLYRRDNGKDVMSMISPSEWGRKAPYEFIATIKLLADHTWDVLAMGELEL